MVKRITQVVRANHVGITWIITACSSPEIGIDNDSLLFGTVLSEAHILGLQRDVNLLGRWNLDLVKLQEYALAGLVHRYRPEVLVLVVDV